MPIFKSKHNLLPGTSYEEATKAARQAHQGVQRRTPRRQPYVRSKYFGGDKVFVNIFWNHLVQKRKGEQIKRAKLYACAIDLLRNTAISPTTIINHSAPKEMLHRFIGQTKTGELFYVQVKQNKKTGRKDFMSVFPAKSSKK